MTRFYAWSYLFGSDQGLGSSRKFCNTKFERGGSRSAERKLVLARVPFCAEEALAGSPFISALNALLESSLKSLILCCTEPFYYLL